MKQNTIKSVVYIFSIGAATSVWLNASGETAVFSGKGAYGEMFGTNGTLRMNVSAFEGASKIKSNNEDQSGADLYGYNNTVDACWYGYATTNSIDFKAKLTGQLTNDISSSGSALMSWYDWCGDNMPFSEVVTFNINLNSITNQIYTRSGTENVEFGNIKVNSQFVFSSAHAAFDAGSYIASPRFGAVSPVNAYIGQSRLHDVEITKH